MENSTEESFPDWLKRTMSIWQWDWPHQLHLYEKLDAVTSGQCRRLMIFMPPRHSKSETVTVRYSAWRLERDPKLNIILGSYNQKLANRFSRKIRRVVEERMTLSKDRKAVDEWETTTGGGVRAVGVGAGVTGFGGSLIVIDDPVKNRAEAESRVRRDNAWEWFNDDIYTRLEPDAAIVLIQTRWHEDDLAGRLLKSMKNGGEKWNVVNLPALAEVDDPLCRTPGEALWPERFDALALERIKTQQGSYSFAALYQQRPVPLDGGLFKRHWFNRIVDRAPDGLVWARGYDLAVSTRESSDYTASFRCAFDADGNLYIADGFRRRIEYPEQRRYALERMRSEQNTRHGVEKALHGQALVQDLQRDARAVAGLAAINVDADKFTRALLWSCLAEAGKIILVQGGWIDEFITEACSFPDGPHDDQVDAVSLAVRMLKRQQGKLHTF